MGDAILRIPRDARVRAYRTRDTYDGVVPVTSKRQPYCHSSYIELSGLYFPRRHQRASTRARKRGAAPDATKFNSAELSRFTPANSSNPANHVPVSRIEFAADRACTYVSELDTGQSARRVGVATR